MYTKSSQLHIQHSQDIQVKQNIFFSSYLMITVFSSMSKTFVSNTMPSAFLCDIALLYVLLYYIILLFIIIYISILLYSVLTVLTDSQ
jgi:hypothetical protein